MYICDQTTTIIIYYDHILYSCVSFAHETKQVSARVCLPILLYTVTFDPEARLGVCIHAVTWLFRISVIQYNVSFP